jgi:tyrosyl-tRNA synthetase
VHGAEQARIAEEAAGALFTSAREVGAPAGAPSFEVGGAKIAEGYLLTEALAQSALCRSKSDARREIEGGGIYVNDERVQSVNHKIGPADVREGVIILRRGKKNYMVLKIGAAPVKE